MQVLYQNRQQPNTTYGSIEVEVMIGATSLLPREYNKKLQNNFKLNKIAIVVEHLSISMLFPDYEDLFDFQSCGVSNPLDIVNLDFSDGQYHTILHVIRQSVLCGVVGKVGAREYLQYYYADKSCVRVPRARVVNQRALVVTAAAAAVAKDRARTR